MKDLYDISDTTDIPEYVNNNFISGNRLRQAILFLIEQAKRPVTSRQIRVAYFRKYHEAKGFFDLSVTQVSLLLTNLITQKRILRVKRGLFEFNKNFQEEEKQKSIMKTEEKNTSNKKHINQIIEILPEGIEFSKKFIKQLIENKLPDLQLNENAISSWLIYLRRIKILNYKDRRYSLNKDAVNKHLENSKTKEETVDMGLLNVFIKTPLTISDIADRMNMSPVTLNKILIKHNITRKRYKGTKIVDFKSKRYWFSFEDCYKELNLPKAYLVQLLENKTKDLLLDLRYLREKDVKKQFFEMLESEYNNGR